jgi:hypothetical protein
MKKKINLLISDLHLWGKPTMVNAKAKDIHCSVDTFQLTGD